MHGSARRRSGRLEITLLVACALGACADKSSAPRQLAGADPARGLELVKQAGCGACHTIPGLAWPAGRVGGSLDGFGARPLIAGRFPNQPATLVAWLIDAPSMAPGVAMPATSLSQTDARDIAAYLYGLDGK